MQIDTQTKICKEMQQTEVILFLVGLRLFYDLSLTHLRFCNWQNEQATRQASPLLCSHLVLRDDFRVIIQNVTKHVTTHALSRLIVKVLKERVEMFQFQDG